MENPTGKPRPELGHRPIRCEDEQRRDFRPRRERVSRHVPHQGQREIERRRIQGLRAERKAYERFVNEERDRALIEWEANNG